MLTSVGRAAARRVVTSSTRAATTTSFPAGLSIRTIKPAAVRSFTSSQWTPQAAAVAASTGTQKTTTTKKKATGTTAKKMTTTATKKKKATTPVVKKKKKVVVAKPKRVKKVLSPEEKEKLKVRDAKVTSLVGKEPATKPSRSWTIFVGETIGPLTTLTFSERIKELKDEWKNVSASDKQRYEAKAAINAEENKRAYKSWVESYPSEDIILANRARSQLTLLTKKKVPKIVDERTPKRPATALARFLQLRLNSSSGSDLQDRFKAVVQEWTTLPAQEKKPFEEAHAQEAAEYQDKIGPLKERVLTRQKELKQAAKAPAKSTKSSEE